MGQCLNKNYWKSSLEAKFYGITYYVVKYFCNKDGVLVDECARLPEPAHAVHGILQ